MEEHQEKREQKREQLQQLAKESSEAMANLSRNRIPIKEIIELFQNNDPKISPIIRCSESVRADAISRNIQKRDPKWAEYNPASISIVPLLEPKDQSQEEKVSLRPELDKAGIKRITGEVGFHRNYAYFTLLQYITLSKGLPELNKEELLNHFGDSLFPVLDHLAKMEPRPKYMDGGIGSMILDYEIIKYHLRKGRPVIVATWDLKEQVMVGDTKATAIYTLLITGFETKDGQATWEGLCFSPTIPEPGYVTVKSITSGESKCFWYE
jgi:hypothetical protein